MDLRLDFDSLLPIIRFDVAYIYFRQVARTHVFLCHKAV